MKNKNYFLGLLVLLSLGAVMPVFAAFANSGPYVSCTTDTSIVVSWQTNGATTTNRVDFGATTSYGRFATAPAGVNVPAKYTGSNSKWVQSATLTGLTASTTYHYKVTSDGLQSVDYTFKTFPPVTTTAGLKFIVFGDSQDDWNGYYVLTDLIAAMGRDEPGYDLILSAGDQVKEGNETNWTLFWFNQVNPLMHSTWISTVIGNHDAGGDGPDDYLAYFALPRNPGIPASHQEFYYSFDYGNVHIIGLTAIHGYDPYDGGPYDYSTVGAEYAWLSRDIDSARAHGRNWIVVLLHTSIYPAGAKWGELAPQNRGLSALLESKRVDMVFSGHEHEYLRLKPITSGVYAADGVHYYITAEAGVTAYPFSNLSGGNIGVNVGGTAKYDLVGTRPNGQPAGAAENFNPTRTSHYVVVEINGGTVKTTTKALASGTTTEVFDTCQWSKAVNVEGKDVAAMANLISVVPNPFNSFTNITVTSSLEMVKNGYSLQIYNIAGRLIEDFSRHAGQPDAAHSMYTWNASKNPAGIYLLRLKTGKEIIQKQIVLMR